MLCESRLEADTRCHCKPRDGDSAGRSGWCTRVWDGTAHTLTMQSPRLACQQIGALWADLALVECLLPPDSVAVAFVERWTRIVCRSEWSVAQVREIHNSGITQGDQGR